MKILLLLGLALISLLALFILSACILSSKISKKEEMEIEK